MPRLTFTPFLLQLEALNDTISALQAKYGKSALLRLGDKPMQQLETTPTGCLSLDAALGGGYPKGRIIEVLPSISVISPSLSLSWPHCLWAPIWPTPEL